MWKFRFQKYENEKCNANIVEIFIQIPLYSVGFWMDFGHSQMRCSFDINVIRSDVTFILEGG